LLGDEAGDAVACGEAAGTLCVLGVCAVNGREKAKLTTQTLVIR
jgi:hypothetical protein